MTIGHDAAHRFRPVESAPRRAFAPAGGVCRHLERTLARSGRRAAGLDRSISCRSRLHGGAGRFRNRVAALSDAAVSSSNPQRLKAWWFYRMVFSGDPLAERLTLMWHNHFATSNAKVDSVGMMRDQNHTFRTGAQKPFGELLPSVVKGPAVLMWLDADKNRAGHANENLGRELLELFTLGIGHYSEIDVQQAARRPHGLACRRL